MTQCHGFCEVYKSDLDNLPDTRRVRRSSKFHRRNESEAEAKEMETGRAEFIDASDREWYTRDHQQLVSRNQEGPVPGHYMQVDGRAVLTNAISTNQRTLFKTHTVLEVSAAGVQQVVILENNNGSVVAIEASDDSVIAKDLPTRPSQYNTLDQVKTAHPEVLFFKVPREPGSELFYFKSYLTDKQRILGFDKYGNALNPTEIQPHQEECLFSMV